MAAIIKRYVPGNPWPVPIVEPLGVAIERTVNARLTFARELVSAPQHRGQRERDAEADDDWGP
jgi:hypothetical protein